MKTLAAILLGAAITLIIRGYQFGESNHTVYLVDAIRRVNPRILGQDWWATATLQYHGVFSWISAGLIRLHIIEEVFLGGYLLLALLLHWGWFRLVRILGGSPQAYLLSVALYYLSAGGLGLGMYTFLQDSAMLPSNIANVAMLWGILFCIASRPAPAGICLGLAGLFHLNHALVGLGLWTTLSLWKGSGFRVQGSGKSSLNPEPRTLNPPWLLGAAALLALSLTSILPALRAILSRSSQVPLSEFVDYYVRLRHPHHYDPSTWPWPLWLAFLWPIPLALIAWRSMRHNSAVPNSASAPSPLLPSPGTPGEGRVGAPRHPATRGSGMESSLNPEPRTPNPPSIQAARIFIFFAALTLLALIGAGLFYVSETLIQLSLYRFSIYLKLIACIAVAWLLVDGRREAIRPLRLGYLVLTLMLLAILLLLSRRPEAAAGLLLPNAAVILLAWCIAGLSLDPRAIRLPVAAIMVIATAAILFSRGGDGIRTGFIPRDDPDFIALAEWAAESTPLDALFLIPPQEGSFRLRARRAIVVDFKGVPQLSGELPQWRTRMEHVLGLEDLRVLPQRFDLTLAAIARQYDAQSPQTLSDVARYYGAAYIVTTSPRPELQALLVAEFGQYRMYAVGK